jgi:hypothetical protein
MSDSDDTIQRNHDRIADLQAQVNNLQAVVDRLEARLDRVQNAEEGQKGAVDPRLDIVTEVDQYDRPVAKRLTPGATITTEELLHLYETYSTITHESKIRDRIKALTDREQFEMVNHGVWKFQPTADVTPGERAVEVEADGNE